MTSKKAENKKQASSAAKQAPKDLFILKASLVLILITFAVYFKSLDNKFTNWDDEGYVTQNPDIRTLHADSVSYSIKNIFTSYKMGNYHPITMLSYSMEYAKYKLSPKPYHFVNLVIHILNTLLVLYFIWLLTKQKTTAFITALLFAIHPMHVESVAWVSERKDVLYTFFSLAALCDYVRFALDDNRKRLYYIGALVMFMLAILSKAMAICLPFIFILIDFYLGRKISKKTLLEKIPFLIMSVIFGLVAIQAQRSFNALEDIANYNFFDRILFSSYGVFMYLWKLILPLNLSCFYSYPFKVDGLYPGFFYISPIIILTLAYLIYRSKQFGKNVLFGFGFFIVSIVMVLQILPVGGAIIADRYTYIPYIGIFFIIGGFFESLVENQKTKWQVYKTPLIGVLAIFVLFNIYQTVARIKIWQNSITLWTDAIDKYELAPRTYAHRGKAYYKNDQYEKAMIDFSKYISIKDDNYESYYDRGLCYFNLKKYDEAIKDYTMSIKLNPKYIDSYYNRGIVYNDLGRYEEAIKDYSVVLKFQPDHSKALYNRAGAYYLTKQNQLALNDALKAQTLGYAIDPRFIEILRQGMK